MIEQSYFLILFKWIRFHILHQIHRKPLKKDENDQMIWKITILRIVSLDQEFHRLCQLVVYFPKRSRHWNKESFHSMLCIPVDFHMNVKTNQFLSNYQIIFHWRRKREIHCTYQQHYPVDLQVLDWIYHLLHHLGHHRLGLENFHHHHGHDHRLENRHVLLTNVIEKLIFPKKIPYLLGMDPLMLLNLTRTIYSSIWKKKMSFETKHTVHRISIGNYSILTNTNDLSISLPRGTIHEIEVARNNPSVNKKTLFEICLSFSSFYVNMHMNDSSD